MINRSNGICLDDVRRAANGRWPDILVHHGFSLDELDPKNPGTCWNCGGKDRRRAFDDVIETGGIMCNQCHSEKNGDGFAAVQWRLRCTFPEALKSIADYLGIRPVEPASATEGKNVSPFTSKYSDHTNTSGSEPRRLRIEATIADWCNKKPPITLAAVLAANGKLVTYPVSQTYGNPCILFEAFDRPDERAVGCILRRVDGTDFEAYGKVGPRKTHTLKGSTDGWIPVGGFERLQRAKYVWWCEGILDALALSESLPDDHCAIANICGAKSAPKNLGILAGKTVYIPGDCDRPGVDGSVKRASKILGIADVVKQFILPWYEVVEDHGKDLRDALNDGHTFAEILELAESAPLFEKPKRVDSKSSQGNGWSPANTNIDPNTNGDRSEVELTTREHDINDAAIVALGADKSIYQRGGQLVTVLKGKQADDSVQRPSDAPRVSILSLATVREKISRHVEFYVMGETSDGPKKTPKHVPDWCAKAIHARGEWPAIPHLGGIINHPILKPDGSILTQPGYDQQTGVILHWIGDPLRVPDSPNRFDAVAAAGRLKQIVSDFPFESEAHRSGWLAFLLTALIRYFFRHAITCPMFLIDASVRGSGKTLLADIVGVIICGFALPRMIYAKDDEELRKHMLCLAMSGDEFALFDNVAGDLGGQTLDAVLTGTTFRGRILGESREVSVAINTTFAATSNNCTITGDLCRRTIPIRLSSPLEKPEEREDFQVPNLLHHVQKCRNEFLKDALTILRAYVVANRPDVGLSAMGSFEDWSSMVRAPLVWCGEPDPWETRAEFAIRADTGVQTLAEILRAWSTVDPEGDGATATEVIQRIESMPHYNSGLKSAICDLCGSKPGTMPTSRSLGKRLGSIRDRVYRSQKIVSRPNRDGIMVWRVESAESSMLGLQGVAGFISGHPMREIVNHTVSNAHESGAVETPQTHQTQQANNSGANSALFEGSF